MDIAEQSKLDYRELCKVLDCEPRRDVLDTIERVADDSMSVAELTSLAMLLV